MSDSNRKGCSYSEKPNNSDLIYRQDALDILEDFETCVYEATSGAYEKARKAMCELQSQPEKRTQERTETRACDSISRQAAIDLFPNDALEWDTKGGYIAPHLARRMIEELPSSQPERKKGHWIEVDDYYNRISGRCSACGWESHLYEDDVVGMNFCPNCGADMRGKE